ncbi:hypothetical protein ABLV66_21265 [Klebsiella sp. CN_Kp073]|uniref:hypothetical protein n=1 Tax=Klebsiella sp. CN_Kp073 TaxID=3153412 RepID=UPI0032B3832D
MTNNQLTKEWLQQTIAELESVRDEIPFGIDTNSGLELAAFKIALAAMDSEPVAWLAIYHGEVYDEAIGITRSVVEAQADHFGWESALTEIIPLYRHAQPEPVVPEEMKIPTIDEWENKSVFMEMFGMATGWNAFRAAMLQSGTLTSEDTKQFEPVTTAYKLPETQFKQVADLYAITSPTGSETTFTFDPVEAANFKDGGWSVQEYVELERLQESLTGNYPVIQDGYVMAPKEPTKEILDEFDSIIDYGAEDSVDAWRRLLAAAPQEVK